MVNFDILTQIIFDAFLNHPLIGIIILEKYSEKKEEGNGRV